MVVVTDTTTGSVTISGTYSLEEMVKYLSRMYPDYEWKQLVTHTTLSLRVPPIPPIADDDLPF